MALCIVGPWESITIGIGERVGNEDVVAEASAREATVTEGVGAEVSVAGADSADSFTAMFDFISARDGNAMMSLLANELTHRSKAGEPP